MPQDPFLPLSTGGPIGTEFDPEPLLTLLGRFASSCSGLRGDRRRSAWPGQFHPLQRGDSKPHHAGGGRGEKDSDMAVEISPPAVSTHSPRLCISLASAHTSQIWGLTLLRGGKQVTEHLKAANCRVTAWLELWPPFLALASQPTVGCVVHNSLLISLPLIH